MNEENQNKIAEFCSISGADTERAEFFLQASGWNTELAISTFFENDGEAPSGGDPELEQMEAPPSRIPPVAPSQPEPAAGNNPSTSSHRSQPSSRIKTLSDWGAGNQPKEESSDEEEGQAYYAGGSETSGQQILGPPRKGGKDAGKIAGDLFKAARSHGAEEADESIRSKRPQKKHFVGTGYRLGESETEASQSVGGATQKKEALAVVLRVWKTGFTVNDGPIRPFQDPQNRQFLESIHRGEVPQELVSLAKGGEVAVDMEDHSSEDFVPSKAKVQAFTGSGQALGAEASTSATVGSGDASQITADASLPLTNIQIRLANGSRLVIKCNHGHTVGQVRNHLVAVRPEYAGVAFSLVTALPSRQLTDDSVTLKDADLLNASIMQKL